MTNGFVVASSAFLFVPTLVSFFRQSLIVTIVFFNAALFSTLYHTADEQEYEQLDLIWASLAVFTALVLLAAIARNFPPWNWRVILPVFLGLTAFIIYFSAGHSNDLSDTNSDQYTLWHSLWHLLVGLAGLFLVWTPVNLNDANVSYGELYQDIVRKYCTTSFNKKTVLK